MAAISSTLLAETGEDSGDSEAESVLLEHPDSASAPEATRMVVQRHHLAPGRGRCGCAGSAVLTVFTFSYSSIRIVDPSPPDGVPNGKPWRASAGQPEH